MPHTADLRVEAWAPDREGCLAEAVAGLVDAFADRAAARPHRTASLRLPPAPDEDLLVALLEEVVYRLDVAGELPVAVEAAPVPGGGLDVRLAMAGTGEVEAVGALPKAVSLHGLRMGAGDGWSCSFTVDV
ncbi:archease [Streptacidiphilus sp. ASG 303]|uniref:archease n=1 Tax=Streptomycetaceae TaxID=2062 RepID=UPI001E499AF2|nr:archease [Streptacidiphilus sp. ASG 303]MCD0484482.1 archease [Streptacidiphilus sp. ASG 303]